MPSNRGEEIGEPPAYIKCDPLARQFPAGWKDVWFRRRSKPDATGTMLYTCPICGRDFDHQLIGFLQGDHVWPYSLFGESSWENYQLICGDCNVTKSNHVEGDVRAVLGQGEFRDLVIAFLRKRVGEGSLRPDAVLTSMLGAV